MNDYLVRQSDAMAFDPAEFASIMRLALQAHRRAVSRSPSSTGRSKDGIEAHPAIRPGLDSLTCFSLAVISCSGINRPKAASFLFRCLALDDLLQRGVLNDHLPAFRPLPPSPMWDPADDEVDSFNMADNLVQFACGTLEVQQRRTAEAVIALAAAFPMSERGRFDSVAFLKALEGRHDGDE